MTSCLLTVVHVLVSNVLGMVIVYMLTVKL